MWQQTRQPHTVLINVSITSRIHEFLSALLGSRTEVFGDCVFCLLAKSQASATFPSGTQQVESKTAKEGELPILHWSENTPARWGQPGGLGPFAENSWENLAEYVETESPMVDGRTNSVNKPNLFWRSDPMGSLLEENTNNKGRATANIAINAIN